MPAYNYSDGIRRILATLPFSDASDFECIIFDNSTNDQVTILAHRLCGRHPNFRVEHFVPSTTPVSNWNGLLKAASGEYVLLLHHDEFFASVADCDRLLSHLRNESPDVALLNLYKFHIKIGWRHLHLPFFLRSNLLRHFPNYLSRHNFIGPTGTFVVKRSLLKNFDHRFKWLVDVAWYRSVLCSASKINFLPKVSIISGVDVHETLTKSLSGSISQLNASEINYLSELDVSEGKANCVSVKRFYFRYLDKSVWLMIRALMLPWVFCSLRRYKDPLRA